MEEVKKQYLGGDENIPGFINSDDDSDDADDDDE